MPTPVILQIKADTKLAAAAVRELNKQVRAAFTAMRESVDALNARMRELVFRPESILRGTDQAAKGIGAVTAAAEAAEKGLTGLQDAAGVAEGGLKSVGASAGSAGKKLTDLAGTSGAVDTALGDMAAALSTADVALLSLDDGAAAAQKSVSGLGRSAASALARIDSLSGAKFDPAGVVAGSDAATAALGRVKLAAAEVQASVRGAGARLFLGGGGGRRGGALTEEAARPMTFGGGVRAGVGAAADIGGAVAMVTTILAAVSGKLAVGFDNMMQGVKGNTTMSDADAADMRRLTLQLMRNGTPEEQIAKAYGHIQNMNYRGADAAAILTQANKMGVATHTNTEDTGQVLARLLREYNQPASRVKAVAETAHLTSAGGDMYLKEFDKYAGKAYAVGSNSRVNMPEVSAMLQAMTQHGLNIAQASTQAVGLITQMRNPTPQAFKYAKSIGLGDYLGSKALEKYQPSGILAAVAEKTGGDPAKIGQIFKNRQGGTGSLILTGMGKGSYDTALNDPKTGTKAAFAGKTNAIDPLYNQQMKQTQQAFAALTGEIKSDFIPIGEKVGPLFKSAIPVVRAVAGALKSLLTGFTELPKPVQEAVIAIGGLTLLGKFLPLLGGFSLVGEKTSVVLGGLAKALVGGGEAAEVGAAGITGMALPLVAVAAAVALFALAWKSDFGHIREVTAKVCAEVAGFVNSQMGQVKAWFTKNMPLIKEAVHTALTFIEQFWHSHGSRIMAIIGPLWDFVKQAFSLALRIIENVVKFALDLITGHWGAAAKDVGAIVADLWKLVESAFVNGGKAIGNSLMLILDTVLDFGKRLFEGMLNAGQQAINGIVGGIKSGIGKVAAAASDLAHSIPSAVTGILQIQSPSRVMHEIGRHTAQGLADGITAGKSGVTAAMRGVVNAALAETNAKRANLLIDHQARALRASGMDASDVADYRESAKAMLSGRGGRGKNKLEAERRAAGEYAATVGETPEQKELHKLGELRAKGLISAQAYSEAYRQIKAKSNQASEKEAARHVEALRQIEDGLKAYAKTPETPSLDRQEAAAHAQYRRQVKGLTEGSRSPYTSVQQQGINDAGTLLKDKLAGINDQRASIAQKKADKAAAEAQAAQEAADSQVKQSLGAQVQLQRELWQHAGGDMAAYFKSLRDEADAALKDVQDKFGPAATHPNAPAVAAATAEHDTHITQIKQQETDAGNQLADQRTQHDLEQGKISQAQYVAYLTQRRDAYAEYSQEWLTLDSQLYAADTELQRKQLQALEDLFAAHKISLADYKKLLGQLAIPASSQVYHDVQEAAAGAQNKSNRQMVGGDDFWGGLVSSASETGSKVLDALFHPKDKQSIFKGLWDDLLGSAESGLKGGLSAIFKNLLTGQGAGGGLNIGGLFGGLFGHGKKAGLPASSAVTASTSTTASASTAFGGLIPQTQLLGMGGAGKGLTGNLLGALPEIGMLSKLGGMSHIHGINGAIGGSGGAGDIFSLASMFIPGGGLLSKLFGGGLFGGGGGLFGGIKKLFHFSGGGIVPGIGNHDSVFAKLMPEEMVLPKGISKMLMQAALPQARMPSFATIPSSSQSAPASSANSSSNNTSSAGDTDASITINQTGDHHYHAPMDMKRGLTELAKGMEGRRRAAVPAS